MAAKHVIDFKNNYQDDAQAATAGTPIFPETVMSAAALESNWGRSELSAVHNNFFGIKAGSTWKGAIARMPTREQDKSGNVYTVYANFRKYVTAADCFRDYIKVITQPRYVQAGVTAAKTPQAQFDALKKGGYATDVSYPTKLAGVLKTLGGIITNNPGTTATTILAVIFFLAIAFKK